MSGLIKTNIEKGVKCFVFQGNSDEICNLALEKELVLITCNLDLFNKRTMLNRVCVHYRDSVWQ